MEGEVVVSGCGTQPPTREGKQSLLELIAILQAYTGLLILCAWSEGPSLLGVHSLLPSINKVHSEEVTFVPCGQPFVACTEWTTYTSKKVKFPYTMYIQD